jgi:serine/threonine-protein kinase
MSPEQSRGGELDERSDVYALGIMLYELASLARPYEGATGKDILGRVAKGDVRPIRDAWPSAPRALAAIIDCALQPERNARYANVTELAADLERFMDGGSPIAEHAPAVKQFARFYMSRDRRLSQLRVMDIDLIAASGTALGIAIGVPLADRIGTWWWIALLACLLTAVPPVLTWKRAMRKQRST